MREPPSTASTCFSSPRIGSRRSIRRPAVCSRRFRHPAAEALRARVGRRNALGRALSRPEDPSSRSRDRRDPSHDRVQPLRHRRHLGGRRTLARHLGRRRERSSAHRSANRRSPGAARDAARRQRVGTRVRRRRSVLLRRRAKRQGQSRAPAPAAFRVAGMMAVRPTATAPVGTIRSVPLLRQDCGAERKHLNVAPRSVLFSAAIWPPWARTIDRLIASPRPSPFSRNVTNGSKTAPEPLLGNADAPVGDDDLHEPVVRRRGHGQTPVAAGRHSSTRRR